MILKNIKQTIIIMKTNKVIYIYIYIYNLKQIYFLSDYVPNFNAKIETNLSKQ